jgi:hypothetical protein
MIFADDVGPWNVSANHRGMIGRTHAQH